MLVTLNMLAIAYAAVDHAMERKPLTTLIDWVRKTGVVTVVRGNVANQMQLGNDDVPVRERGFRSISGGITHVFAVGSEPRFANVVVIARVDETTGDAIVWSTSASGQLEFTVKVDPKVGAQRIINSPNEADFVAEKKYFLAQMQAADNRPVPLQRDEASGEVDN
jgi:hypothetical protein